MITPAAPTLSLLHTTARLPTGWRKAAEHWLHTCAIPEAIEHVLVTDDPIEFDPVFPVTRYGVNTGARSPAAGWNKAAEMSSGNVLITLADDWFSPPNWDLSLLMAIARAVLEDGRSTAMVVDVDNGDHQTGILPHSIVTRSYYQRFGYLFHPSYDGLMADVEFTEVARASGCVVDARHLLFQHLNPDAGTAEWDDVYRSHRDPQKLRAGQENYARRQALGFPID